MSQKINPGLINFADCRVGLQLQKQLICKDKIIVAWWNIHDEKPAVVSIVVAFLLFWFKFHLHLCSTVCQH